MRAHYEHTLKFFINRFYLNPSPCRSFVRFFCRSFFSSIPSYWQPLQTITHRLVQSPTLNFIKLALSFVVSSHPTQSFLRIYASFSNSKLLHKSLNICTLSLWSGGVLYTYHSANVRKRSLKCVVVDIHVILQVAIIVIGNHRIVFHQSSSPAHSVCCLHFFDGK